MGIRTVEEYKESLRDGRQVYIRGEKVEDVTKHRILGITCDTIAAGYELTASKDPEVRDLFVAPHPETGEPINRYFITPGNKKDLVDRTKMIQHSIQLIGGLPFGKDIGTDCLNAAFVVAGQMGKQQYQDNAKNFLEHLRKNDLHTCGAVTCVKGDRSKDRPNRNIPITISTWWIKTKTASSSRGPRYTSPVPRQPTKFWSFPPGRCAKMRPTMR